MADIRQSTTIRDDFNRANENPVQPPWYQPNVGIQADMAIGGNALVGTALPPTGSLAYWSTESWNGDQAEVWATATGSLSIPESYRIGLIADPGTGTMDGYVCLPELSGGGSFWSLRKYTNSGFSTLISLETPPAHSLPGAGDIVLMRCAGNNVQVWISDDNGANWTNIIDYADSTYRTGLYAALGTTGNVMGWDNFGGGALAFIPQIYRRPNE